MSAKPPILFLHGAFAGPEIWTRFVAPWFSRRGHPVAVPHLSERSGRPPRLRDYVRRARAAAAAMGEKPVVVGYSLGGLVAQHLAAEGGAAGLVLVASPGPFGLGPSLVRLSSQPDVMAALLLVQAGAGGALGRDLVRRALFSPETPEEWIDGVMNAAQREPLAALLDGMLWDLPAWPLVRRAPVLAVMGDSDAFVPLSDLWTIGALYGAETEVLPGRGHGLPIDPSWKSLAWRIDAWIGERAEAPPPAPFWPLAWMGRMPTVCG